MIKFHGGYSTTNLRKNIKLPESLKPNIANTKIKKRKSFNKDIYNININNFNINTRRELFNNFSKKTTELFTDFKKVLEQTETIKKRIFNNNFNIFPKTDKTKIIFKGNNFNKNKSKKNPVSIDLFESPLNPIKKYKNIELNKEVGNSFYFPESSNYSNRNKNFNILSTFQTPKINKNISLRKNFDIKFMELENKNLKKESDFLINEYDFLRSKIKEYKTKIKNNFYEGVKFNNYLERNINNYINSIKLSLNNYANNNLELSQMIINTLKKLQDLGKEINIKLVEKKQKKFIKDNFEENNKRFNELNKERNKLNFELEKLKIFFEDLKIKEKILSFKYESEYKARKDKINLINQLKNTIKELNKSQEKTPKSGLNPIKNLNLNINSNTDYSKEIDILNLKHKFLESEKNILIKQNKILKTQKTDIRKLTNEENNTKLLQEKFNILKKENHENKLKLEKKEKQIKILKDVINKTSNALKEGNNKDEIFKLDLDKLTEEDFDDTEYINLLIKNKLKILINKKNNYQRKQNTRNINNFKTYEDIIKRKDLEISRLEDEMNHKNGILKIIEDKVKPLYKKNNTISKTSSFLNSISDNINTIKEKSHFKGNINWKNQ